MTNPIHRSPFALTASGELLVNVALVKDPDDIAQVVELAQSEAGPVFIGVGLTPEEKMLVGEKIENAAAEVAAWVIGKRRRSSRQEGLERDAMTAPKDEGNE